MKKKLWDHALVKLLPGANKILLKMKLTLCIILFSFLGAMATDVYSQTTKLSLDLKNTSVKEVLGTIENQSEFFFLYSEKLIDVTREVNIEVRGSTIERILDRIFAGTNVNYTVRGRQIVLTTPEADLFENSSAAQQQKSVSGKVTDTSGSPLPGVTVVVKGTNIGTISDTNGNYSLPNVPEKATLVFSFVGMQTQEVVIGSQSTINVSLADENIGIEEVVAIGYGSQKKVNLTGAVGHITSESLDYKTVSNVSQALSGELSGVTVQANTGAPGRNTAQIIIRGLGTFSGAGNNPLVLVDGIPSSINSVNPNDIQSVSVLKDASSASIYGSRAANGVILIETKKGKAGTMVVNYSGYVGRQVPTKFPDFVPSWEYAELQNEFLINSGSGAIWSDDDIAKFRSGEDPDNYPNVNHYKDLFTSGSGFQTGHNFSLSGGEEDIQYRFSTGYIRQDGMIAKNTFDRYNVLLNLTSKLADRFELNVSLGGDVSTIDEPSTPGSIGTMTGSIINMAIRMPVIYPGKRSDGTYGYLQEFYPQAALDSESFLKNKDQHLLGNASLKWNIFDGLSLLGRVGYDRTDSHSVNFASTMVLDQFRTLDPSMASHRKQFDNELILEALVNYEKSFGDHKVLILAGYNQDEYRNEFLTGFRDNFPSNLLHQLNAASAENMSNSGGAYEWALQSYFGRMNYSYQDKYLFETNFRYDGSSRFPADTRWGLFPSVSAGWKISEEDFFHNNIPWIDNLTLRGSYGTLGNQQIGNYPYQSVLSLGRNYPFGVTDAIQAGARVVNLANKDITWEKTTVKGAGFNLTSFGGRLNLVVDYFDKRTNDILYSISTAALLGFNTGESNAGEVSNKGWDFDVIYRNSVGSFNYSVATNFSVVNNKVLNLADVDRDIDKGLFVGEPLQSIYGYVADGLFVDQDDINNYPTQSYITEPGFIRFKDIAGPDGGPPDGIVDPVNDRQVLGSRFPRYSYGATFRADYKSIDFLIQFQGLGGMQRDLGLFAGMAFRNESTPQRWMVEDRWTVENPDRNASYPKWSSALQGGSPRQTSSFWLIDASYLRLKNLQIGYKLPSSILNKLNIRELRVYLSGSNLLTFDKFFEGWDPEPTNPGATSFYPFTSVFSIGVNTTF